MLSDDRQSYWVHLIVKGLLKQNLVRFSDSDKAMQAGRRAMAVFIKQHQQIESKVRQKILSLKRQVTESSSEWEVLYSQYYNEELTRSRLGSFLRK